MGTITEELGLRAFDSKMEPYSAGEIGKVRERVNYSTAYLGLIAVTIVAASIIFAVINKYISVELILAALMVSGILLILAISAESEKNMRLTWLQGVSESPISQDEGSLCDWNCEKALKFFREHPEYQEYWNRVAKSNREITRMEVFLLEEDAKEAKRAALCYAVMTANPNYPVFDGTKGLT